MSCGETGEGGGGERVKFSLPVPLTPNSWSINRGSHLFVLCKHFFHYLTSHSVGIPYPFSHLPYTRPTPSPSRYPPSSIIPTKTLIVKYTYNDPDWLTEERFSKKQENLGYLLCMAHCQLTVLLLNHPPGKGYSGYFWVGVCRWDFDTLALFPDHVQLHFATLFETRCEKFLP